GRGEDSWRGAGGNARFPATPPPPDRGTDLDAGPASAPQARPLLAPLPRPGVARLPLLRPQQDLRPRPARPHRRGGGRGRAAAGLLARPLGRGRRLAPAPGALRHHLRRLAPRVRLPVRLRPPLAEPRADPP